MITRTLRIVTLVYLWGALIEDSVLFVLSWLTPNLWFQLFHAAVPSALEIAFLRRSGGQWAAFALGQAITFGVGERIPHGSRLQPGCASPISSLTPATFSRSRL